MPRTVASKRIATPVAAAEVTIATPVATAKVFATFGSAATFCALTAPIRGGLGGWARTARAAA